jgi:hypothetical protein
MQYSSIRLTEHFFDMLIKLIQRVPTMKMKYFKGIGSVNFPTIFRQLSDERIKSKAAPPGLEPKSFEIKFFYSTTGVHEETPVGDLVLPVDQLLGGDGIEPPRAG